MSFLLTLFGGAPWKLIGIGAGILVILGCAAYCTGEVKRAGKLEAQLDAAIDTSNANAAAAERFAAEVKRVNAAAAKAGKAKNDIRAKSAVVQQEIIDTLPKDDGILAPVLRRELDRLPEPEGSDALRTTSAGGSAGGVTFAYAGTVPPANRRYPKDRGVGFGAFSRGPRPVQRR